LQSLLEKGKFFEVKREEIADLKIYTLSNSQRFKIFYNEEFDPGSG